MTEDFTRLSDLDGPGEARSNVAELARLFPDAVVDGTVDLDVLRDLLGESGSPAGAEGFGLRWPGMSDARRLSTIPATMTLLPKPEESVAWESTKNIVIEGDNLEVLRLLRRAYTNSVDVIYIDPPYNTGNDFVYNDTINASSAEHETSAGLRDVDGILQVGAGSDRAGERRTGGSSHSKWLSMMYPRLLVAHHLLKETGVAIVAIDDTEHARLKLLLDRVFGAENFAANAVWQGSGKNDSRFTSGGLDYMLIYAKNKRLLVENDIRWKEPKRGYDLVVAAAERAWSASGGDSAVATQEFRKWWRSNPDTEKGLTNYSEIDDAGRAYRRSDLRSPNPRPNLQYEILHPVTRQPIQMHPNGWAYSRERMDALLAEGRILFGRDHTQTASYKRYLHETADQSIRPTVNQDRANASDAVASLLGPGVFDYPKDTGVIGRWVNAVCGGRRDAIVLDFFAGSGSTGHAVMELNASDGGTRRYVLVQLDEPIQKPGYETIAAITRERLRRAGEQIANSRHHEAEPMDCGFRSYRLADSNVRPWDGSGELDLLSAVDNLVAGRTTDDLLVEVMLRLGIDLVTPVGTREVAGSALYSVAGTLYAFFGTDVDVAAADQVAKAIVGWRDDEPVDSDITVVVRDTGFADSSAKLNLAEALKQAGINTFRSI
ncbi:site-specific DNA-methyltransferase [Paenibacillus sp. TRM 82003]|uniref:site-specific DNA-methyltransferase n=1 Tax=Kineococcus sp. TRM81007 TaxID=2925831 RepID=UPI001F55EB25|nr:site-specific DNA-methyltransferase [Kineococcus sp. TRM81007]MCI2237074.1 site-specific DNA-methyltransferase [Kineococcus sp. TRM81007]MCI3926459.1 site-specific DNA-methyltransferase [Paenibacillus sp. TRM 82003]